jgi:hypothetical protein
MDLPVLIHTHGIRDIDYSAMGVGDLPRIEQFAREDGLLVVPGVFLARDYIPGFRDVVRHFAENREAYPHVLGFSVEGPLLGRLGGVPPRGIWSPTAQEWDQIAELGQHGLKYIVIGPDGGDLDDFLEPGVTFRDVIDRFYGAGVRLALGHFRHDQPRVSAERTQAVIDYVQLRYGPGADVILTDHLFNDMPRNFRHVWRTEKERRTRERELGEFLRTPWTEENLDTVLGEVPACIIKAAMADQVMPFLNFDGDHVDLTICARTLAHMGPQRLIGITDDTELPLLAGEDLSHREGNGLWYRSDGIVAAGTGHIRRQYRNLEAIGYGGAAGLLFRENQLRALAPLGAGRVEAAK